MDFAPPTPPQKTVDDPQTSKLVGAVITEVLRAVHAASGRRWATRGTQDQWHEGADSEAAAPDPVRLDSFVRIVCERAASEPASNPADDEPTRLARAVLTSLTGWTPGHFYHMFGVHFLPADAIRALDAPRVPEPIEYFRRSRYAATPFTPDSVVLTGVRLPLAVRRLFATPSNPDATRTLYARTDRQYEVPPTAGERAEALGG